MNFLEVLNDYNQVDYNLIIGLSIVDPYEKSTFTCRPQGEKAFIKHNMCISNTIWYVLFI